MFRSFIQVFQNTLIYDLCLSKIFSKLCYFPWLVYFKYRRLYCFSSRGSALTISNDVTALEIMTRPGQSRALPVLTDSSAVFYLGVLPVSVVRGSQIKINNAGTMWGICISYVR